MSASRDLDASRYGEWTVLDRAENSLRGDAMYRARCSCGTIKEVAATALRRGYSQRCRACAVKRIATKRQTHAMSDHPVYAVWKAMKQRCCNPRDQKYADYGGRGITLEWPDFEAFWDDMRDGYRPGLEIDRIDNNGSYSRENCRWTTRAVQVRNTRRTRLIDTPWGRMPLSDAAQASGLNTRTLTYRVNKKWPPDLLFGPPQ